MLLRALAGRRRQRATWAEEPSALPVATRASFTVGALSVVVQPLGVQAAGTNAPSAIYEVRVTAGGAWAWASRYGFPPAGSTAEAAADAALDELYEIWRTPEAWEARLTEGMSEDEAEAILDGTLARADHKGAEWIGPRLDLVYPAREANGSWLGGVT
jgi:hypothetical protein